MTVVKINAITVPPDGGDELARRFAARAGAVDNQDGFEGFELLRPTDERTTWLVVTRWRDEAAFEAWRTSPAFGHGHRQAAQAAAAGEGGPEKGLTSSSGFDRNVALSAPFPCESLTMPKPTQSPSTWTHHLTRALTRSSQASLSTSTTTTLFGDWSS